MNDPIVNKRAERFIPVAKPHIDQSDINAVVGAMEKCEIALGDAVGQFEKEFAQAHNREYGSSCNSGTSALILALAALDVWEMDRVVMPSFSMVALSNAVLVRRGIPVFCDSDQNSLVGNTSLDCIKETIEKYEIQPKAIIVQHTYGEPIKDIDDISFYCWQKDIKLIEDCAEAPYAKINERSIGTFGDIAIFSTYGNKCITSSEGGFCISNNKELIDRINVIKAHAFSHHKHFCHTEHAYGLRMPNICAALGLNQHRKHKQLLQRRYELRVQYEWQLPFGLTIPNTTPGSSHWVMPVVCDSEETKDRLRHRLAEYGIETRSYFVPMHQQIFLKEFVLPNQTFPIADRLASRGFYLPLYPSLSNSDVKYICNVIKDFYNET